MARANAAYYASHNPFADFVTAPEISQMFGELLGAWAASCWQAMGQPARVILAEAGPGRGTLMADALRLIARLMPGFAQAAEVWLIETSPRLRAEQATRVPGARFADDLNSLPPGPMILLANEFLDALPIRQFRRTEDGWMERFVADGAFVEEPCPPPPREAEVGEIVEICEPAEAFVAALAARVKSQGGIGLLIDYGPMQSGPGDSLQALRGGKPADPLADPGAADVTAHVDFARLKSVAESAGAAVYGPLAQGSLLSRLGIYQRAQQLARGKEPNIAMKQMSNANRLADPAAMGSLFKALAVAHPHLAVPPGFTIAGFAP
jgi:NADH dehydrogenase [ubiquinone] 1 alpha subcomplex assembly factor 7